MMKTVKMRKIVSVLLAFVTAFSVTGVSSYAYDAAMESDAAAASTSSEGSGSEKLTVTGQTLITDVFGDGQKAWIAVLKYGTNIDPSSVSTDDFEVENYDIENVYVNTEAELPDKSTEGEYVLIELKTDNYTTANYGGTGATSSEKVAEALEKAAAEGTSQNDFKIPVNESDDNKVPGSGGQMGRGTGAGRGSLSPSNQLTVTIKQTGDISSADGAVINGSQTEYATKYADNENLLVENFKQYTFTTQDGTEMMYSLYIPEDYDGNTKYPLMTFMPDATGEGDDAYLALTESLGASIWTTDERQAKYRSIVLVPQYTDANTQNDEYTMELIQSIIASYSVDESRLYLSGQSSGTIRSIKLLIDYPDTFAASMLTAGQADSAYVDSLSKLADQKIWMICSAGDVRAYPGMQAITDAVEGAGTAVEISQWSAKLSDDEQEKLAAEQEETDSTIYWTVYDKGTVMRDDVTSNDATEHMNTWRNSYTLDTVMDWVYSQTK
jgi:predicted peptidase